MVDPNFHHNVGSKKLHDLAKIASADMDPADSGFEISDVAPLDQATGKDISFFDNIKYKQDLINTKAGACIVSEKMKEFAPKTCKLLISDNPYKSYALIAQSFYPDPYPKADISDRAVIHETVSLGQGCVIEPGVVIKEGVIVGDGCWIEANTVIGANVQIGEKCRIGANVTISHSIIGAFSRLYPGVRLGQDGFGFAIDPAGHVKVPQLGRVVVGEHVEIGANTCIDRGAGPDTIIGDGTWIDNCVQIGHNVKTGKGCVIVAQAGVAGSSTLEDYVVVAAQAGIAGHLNIGQGSQVAAQSGVMHDLSPGSKVMGAPALPIKQAMRAHATIKKMLKRN